MRRMRLRGGGGSYAGMHAPRPVVQHSSNLRMPMCRLALSPSMHIAPADGSDDEQRGRGRSRSASPRRAASRSASPRAGRCGGGEGGRADKAADEQRAEAGRKLPPRGTGPRSLFKSALQAASVAGSERERKRHRGD